MIILILSSGVFTGTATAIIVVEDSLTLEITNVFKPNGDRVNNLFAIKLNMD